MDIEHIAKKVDTQIVSWSRGHDKLVVAIDGYTGTGKTALLDSLAGQNNDILPIHRDDFMYPRKKVEALIKNATDPSEVFELEACDNQSIEKFINLYRKTDNQYTEQTYNAVSGERDVPKVFDLSKKIMVIEGVFMFHPKLLDHFWDRRIYLYGNIAAIDERRVAREREKWGEQYVSETRPDSYFRQVIIALKRYQKNYKPAERADLLVNVDL